MAPKAPKPTSDELLAQFDDLGLDSSGSAKKPAPKASTTSATSAAGQSEPDILAELDNLASQRPSSGQGTPRLSTERGSSNRSPRPGAVVTPSSTDRSSEEKTAVRKSDDSHRSSRAPPVSTTQETTPAGESSQGTTGGGWWGGIFATASAAMKQAEAAVKEIQKNEEALKWAQQVRGNVGALRDLGGELRNIALPTFTSLIHTLAPPISSHERLQIHVTHDLSGYPSVDPLIYEVFSRVMSQVEGGDLLVIQRGQESAPRRGASSHGSGLTASTAGWRDGPWWRSVTPGTPRSISAVRGMVEATKLARASAESYATEYYASRGGIEEAAKQATEVLNESNPVRNSDIFLSIQAVVQPESKDLFQAGPTAAAAAATEPSEVVDAETTEDEVAFALYLHDPIHGIAFHTVSQTIPQQWIDWLDAGAETSKPEHPATGDDPHVARSFVPESIAEIIESGGIDPREWVAEWVEECLSLAVGVVAQRYVARRMGVGEGGPGKGKMRAEMATTVESGAGEVARAL